MPISKLMRVRVEVFMKIMATARPAPAGRAIRRAFCSAFSSVAKSSKAHYLRWREVVDGEETAAGERKIGHR